MSTEINVDIENIVEYLTNSVNIASRFYDIFLNPEPMLVTFEQYNDENKLIEVTIPNRAMDLKNIRTGEGAPEGQVTADIGTLYIDSSTPQLYIKVDGTNENGWVAIPNQEETISILENYLVAEGYATEQYVDEAIGNGTVTFIQGGVQKGTITMNQKGNSTITLDSGGGGGSVVIEPTFIPNSTNPPSCNAITEYGFISNLNASDIENALGYVPYDSSNPNNYISSVPVATTSTEGTVKFDNSSITLNSNSQIQTSGVIEQKNSVNTKFWVGTEAEYNSIATKDPETLYIIKDTES